MNRKARAHCVRLLCNFATFEIGQAELAAAKAEIDRLKVIMIEMIKNYVTSR
jgi:hypothetical protein